MIELNPAGDAYPFDFVQVGDVAFFVADDGTHGRELWKTDGTPDGTSMVKDINPGSGWSDPRELTEFNGELFFVADDGSHGQELWKSDGTDSGTIMVHDINPGEGYQYGYGDGPLNSFPRSLTEVDGLLFFSAEDAADGAELWRTDGTKEGTMQVKDIATGTSTDYYGTYPNASDPQKLVNFDGTLFFTADDGNSGRELWKSNGTAAGTVRVKDIAMGTSTDNYGTYPNSSHPDMLTMVDGVLFFGALDETNGAELWKSDGTGAGTELVKDINPGNADSLTADSSLVNVDGTLFFIANNGTDGAELWKSDGTTGGTSMVKNIGPGSESGLGTSDLVEVGGTLFFAATDGTHGTELWKSDGTEAGTVMVRDIDGTSSSSSPEYLTEVNGTLFFSAFTPTKGEELWRSNGTSASTVLVDDLFTGVDSSFPLSLFDYDGTLLFSATNSAEGRELWTLDTDAVEDPFEARLTIFVDGQREAIPANVGFGSDGTRQSQVYTDAGDGVLRIAPIGGEPLGQITLGSFFETWRTNSGLIGNNPDAVFDADQLLGNQADMDSTVQMFVNGDVSTGFDGYVLQEGDQIVLVFGENPVVSLNTNFGPLVIELFESQKSLTVDNFLNYVNDEDYIDSFFHRSVKNFVIQAGGFTTPSTTFIDTDEFDNVPTDPPILNEAELSNVRGTVAMARTNAPHSATSQFFVNTTDNLQLDFGSPTHPDGYAVFGQVLDMTAVDAIAALPINTSNSSPYDELPLSTDAQLAVIQSLEGNGRLTGVKFFDANSNGVRDAGEVGLAGVSVFLDANNNGVLDAGETSTTTDANGQFLLQAEAGTYTVRAEVSAGRISTLPHSPDRRTVTVEIGRETDGLDFGEATFSPPSNIDLLAVTDSGAAGDDNLTNRNNATSEGALQFQVDQVLSGAEVRIYAGDVQIGSVKSEASVSGTISLTSVLITTDGLTPISDGTHNITATQLLDGHESDPSAALVVTVDTVSPAAITSLPPDYPQVGYPFTFDVASPDEGQTGVTYSLGDEPAGMTIHPQTGVIAWTPSVDQAVPQTFEIRVADAAGNVSSQEVKMTVLGVIPAYPETYQATEDTLLDVIEADGVLDNDGDANSGPLSAVVVDQPAHGVVTMGPNGSFKYTPDADFFGTDSFTYMASDANDDSNVAEVTIEVAGVNDPPTGVADGYAAAEDTGLTIDEAEGVLANDHDPDGDPLTATLADQADHGTVALDPKGSFGYAPDANFSGTDSFTYTVSDGTVTSAPVTVTLTVAEIPDPPTAVADSYSVDEDGKLTKDDTAGVLANDTDPDSSVITAALVTSPANGSLTLNDDGSFEYTPDPDFFGTDSFTYVASDGTNDSQATTVTITVNAQADPPAATDDSFTAPNDGTVQTLDVLQNDTSDPDGSQTLTLLSVTQGSEGGTVAISGGSISYTAPVGFVGTETFTYTIEDSDGMEDTATVTVSVVDASDNSLSGFVYFDVDADGVRDEGEIGVPGALITLTGTDNFGTDVTRTAITRNNGSYVFLELPSGTYQLTEKQPEALIDGMDTTPVADAVIANDQFSNLLLNGGETLAENNFGEGSLRAQFISISLFLASTPSPEEYLPELIARAEELAGNVELAEAIRSGATDLDGGTNQAPVGIDDTYTVESGDELTVAAASGVLANDVDPDGDALTASVVDTPAHGTLALEADGSFTYTPEAEFSGEDSFTYQANDGLLDSGAATVTITVDEADDGGNDAPVAVDDAYSVDADSELTVEAATGLLANDTDADGDSLAAQLEDLPDNGTVDLSADGSFTYTPDSGFSGTDSFTYVANDGSLQSNEGTVTITVDPVNHAPEAAGDSYSVEQDGTLSIDAAEGVLANDTDQDGDALTASLVDSPNHGTLTLNDDGSFIYTPDAGYDGADSFTYRAHDGELDSDTSTVAITVEKANEAPVAQYNSYFQDEDKVLSVDASSGVLANDSDANGDPLTAHLVDHPDNGTVTLNDTGSFDYTPDADFHGEDTFTYQAYDGELTSNEVTVTITIEPVNDAPVSQDDSYPFTEDTELSVNAVSGVLANDSDVEQDPLIATRVTGPAHGTLTLLQDGSFTYTPETGFHGADSFTYKASDGFAESAEATVTLTGSASALADAALEGEDDWLA